MIYFTADTHFDHVNILRFCNRPFGSVEEMNEALIANWNRKVHGDDTVYITGDMFFRTTDPKPILQRLKGKKRLIVGNHDSQWMKTVELSDYFESVDHYLETCDGQRKLTLCHFPQMCWNHQKRSFMIHGHIHENTDMDYWPLIVTRENLLNAGVDINNYEPVTFEELVENNRKFKALHPKAAESVATAAYDDFTRHLKEQMKGPEFAKTYKGLQPWYNVQCTWFSAGIKLERFCEKSAAKLRQISGR